MKKIIVLLFAVSVVTACTGTPPPPPPEENPNVGPELTVEIPELFSPDPDIVDDPLRVSITVSHPVAIKEWVVQVNRNFGGQAGQTPAAAAPAAAPAEGQGQRRQRQGQDGEQGERRPRAFFEQTGKGTPPETWLWNGKSSRQSAEMVQSATDYRINFTVTDVYDNTSTYEGIISVDVLVKREGDNYRIIVPSIIFPPDSADFSRLNDDDRRANDRVLRLISRALNRYESYKITVEGHSNPTTPPGAARNTQETRELGPLSKDRAQAVVNYLATNGGIAQSRMTAVGMGGTKTVAAYDDSEENWKNRRVEFLLHR